MNPFSHLPNLTDTDLAAMDIGQLIDCLLTHADQAPRALIDACTDCGDRMVQAVSDRYDSPLFWDDANTDGTWWLRLHTAMILSLIPTEHAGTTLIKLMRRLDTVNDHDTQDWLAGKWPALFANKPASLANDLRELVLDRTHDGYIRVNALDPYLAFEVQESASALDTALDWAAEIAATEDEDWYVRLNLGNTLLDFPRDRHRRLLEELAARQQGLGAHFDTKDIEHAYTRGYDEPDWIRFKNPWDFYDPEAIETRQQRWAEEFERAGLDGNIDWDEIPEGHEPYVRLEPKIDRNDPCPCGSGKKYKKCCLCKSH